MPRKKTTDQPQAAAGVAEGETYGRLRARLDEVMAKLQDPDCDVDQAAGLYEQALGCIAKLEHHLQAAENRVRKAQLDTQAEAGSETGTGPEAGQGSANTDRNGDGLVD